MLKRRLIGGLICLLAPTLAVSAKPSLLTQAQSQLTQGLAALANFGQQAAVAEVVTPAPSPTEIADGAILAPGQSGYAVNVVKRLMRELDYPVRPGDFFDQNLSQQIGKFQQANDLAGPGSSHWGEVGPATLRVMREKVLWSLYDPGFGKRLADYARSHASGGRSNCYRYVAYTLHAHMKPFLDGMHAYMAAPYLARNPHFREVAVPATALAQLPPGAVVVWDKGNSRSGHISIADGHGKEISDHVQDQMLSHYGGAGHRVFLPVETRQ